MKKRATKGKDANIPPAPRKRKPYAAPKLEDYGSVNRLTQAKGGVKNDGGFGNPMTRV